MKKKATFISKNEIITISEFLNLYINTNNSKKLIYKGQKKLTHKVLEEFLLERGILIPKKGIFCQIKKEEYITYKYLLVSDALGKVTPYLNPVYNVENIKRKIDCESQKLDLQEIRKKILSEMGYEYSGLFNDEVKKKDIINFSDYTKEEQVESSYYDDIIIPNGKLPKRYFKNDKHRKMI